LGKINPMKIVYVGPGAIGLYYGAKMLQANLPVQWLTSPGKAAWGKEGLSLRGYNAVDETWQTQHFKAISANDDPYATGIADWLIITTKSTGNKSIEARLMPMVEPEKTILLTLQNGMGNAEWLHSLFPQNPILAGLCFVCANRIAPGVVENYHPGRVEIGSFQDRWEKEALAACQLFEQAQVRVNHTQRLAEALWRKLCWNIPFNGLSVVLGGITTDRILAEPESKARAEGLMHEVQAIAAKEMVLIDERFLQSQIDITYRMAAYRPSSLVDFVAGRPLELEAIWGAPLRCAKKNKIATPLLEELYNELCALDKH
jgi:2-dehydropantoate 2-reductase